jgi:hypothetical protein
MARGYAPTMWLLAFPATAQRLARMPATEAADAAAESATDRAERSRWIPVVLDPHDLPVAQRQDLRPPRTRPIGCSPRVGDCDPIASLADILQLPVGGTLPPVKFDPRLENLTGLVGAASRRRRTPEAPAMSSPAPHHPLMHERDERLDISPPQSVIRRADRLDRHRRPVYAAASRRSGWCRDHGYATSRIG